MLNRQKEKEMSGWKKKKKKSRFWVKTYEPDMNREAYLVVILRRIVKLNSLIVSTIS